MAKTITTTYLGNLHMSTDAPLNEQPITVDGKTFTPIDLLVTAYGSCLLGTMEYAARKNYFEIGAAKSEIKFSMSKDKARIGTMNIKIILANDFTNEQKNIIEFDAINHCHVGNSLFPDIKKEYQFLYNQK